MLLLDEEHRPLHKRVGLACSWSGNDEHGAGCGGDGFLLGFVGCAEIEVGEVLRQETFLFCGLGRSELFILTKIRQHGLFRFGVLTEAHNGLVGVAEVIA